MREIQASEAKTHLARLLDEVELGETLVITRHGRAIARVVPEAEVQRGEIRRTLDRMKQRRREGPRISIDELLSARNEGRM